MNFLDLAPDVLSNQNFNMVSVGQQYIKIPRCGTRDVPDLAVECLRSPLLLVQPFNKTARFDLPRDFVRDELFWIGVLRRRNRG